MSTPRIVLPLALLCFILISHTSAQAQDAAQDATQDAALGMIAAASPQEGERLFLRCKACHTIDKGAPNRLGPNLWGVIGHPKASVPGFNYSPALKKLGGDWDYAALSAYLENPRAFAPGNRMAFPGLKDPRQRAAVIAYLRTKADSPVPPPSAAAPAEPAPQAAEAEDFGGLPEDEGREEVHAICSACHSLRLVTQQGLTAQRWDELMDWMTEKQGMPELTPDMRQRVVSYLAEHFGPQSRGRGGINPMMPAMPPPPNP